MAIELIKKTGESRLQKEIAPFSREDMMINGVAIVSNPDPVLQYLQVSDESHYRMMERAELAISSSIQKRVGTIISAGSDVQAGKSGSDKAKKYKDFAITLLKGVPAWTTVQEKALEAVFWGWRPLEVILNTNMRFNGGLYWGIKKIDEKMPEEFKFTLDRDLVYIGDGFQDPVFFDRPEDELHWWVCTSGSTNNPYGEALMRKLWFVWYIKNRFMQMFSTGMERSNGVIIAKQQINLETIGKQATMAQLADELSDVLSLFSNNNILIQRAGWELEFVGDVEFSEGWKYPLDYCDELMRNGIIGGSLTMQVGDVGSRAAADVHEGGTVSIARKDAKVLEGWVNEGLIRPYLEVNFGEIEDDDLPKWRSKISNPVNIENAHVLYQLGAPIDGIKLAAEAGVPLVLDPTDDDLVLKKPELLGTALQGRPPLPSEIAAGEETKQQAAAQNAAKQQAKPVQQPQRKPDKKQGKSSEFRRALGPAMRQIEDVETAVNEEIDRVSEKAKPSTQRYLESLLDRWLAVHPDPLP